jgi:hypothetical protein
MSDGYIYNDIGYKCLSITLHRQSKNNPRNDTVRCHFFRFYGYLSYLYELV